MFTPISLATDALKNTRTLKHTLERILQCALRTAGMGYFTHRSRRCFCLYYQRVWWHFLLLTLLSPCACYPMALLLTSIDKVTFLFRRRHLVYIY